MRMPAWDQRQVDGRYVNEERSRDEDNANPETPISMGALPIRTMAMIPKFWVGPRLVMRVVTHCLPAFPISS
jgi:hypothetical protein